MKTITILTEDRPGVITEICEALGARDINIETIDADTHLNKGVILLTVARQQHDEALEVLKDQGLQAISDESLLLELSDKPGVIAKIAKRFSDAGINIKGMRIMSRNGTTSIVALTVSAEKQQRAIELIEDVLIR